jgi:hypothetical protein
MVGIGGFTGFIETIDFAGYPSPKGNGSIFD